MPGAARLLLCIWLGVTAAAALPGWLIARFLPMWASIPLNVLLALAATMVGVLFVVAAVPGDSAMIKRSNHLYSIMFPLIAASPTVVVVSIYRWCV